MGTCEQYFIHEGNARKDYETGPRFLIPRPPGNNDLVNPYLGHKVDFAGRFGVNQLHGLTSAHGNLLFDWSILQRAKRGFLSCLQQLTIVI